MLESEIQHQVISLMYQVASEQHQIHISQLQLGSLLLVEHLLVLVVLNWMYLVDI
jgi:hypothetical protein